MAARDQMMSTVVLLLSAVANDFAGITIDLKPVDEHRTVSDGPTQWLCFTWNTAERTLCWLSRDVLRPDVTIELDRNELNEWIRLRVAETR